MNVIKTWRVHALQYKEQVFDLPKVITSVTWRLDGTDGTNSNSIFGAVAMPAPAGDFTPFDELNEPQVLAWCHSQLGAIQVAAYENEITAKIQAYQNPDVPAAELPWVTV